jgi:RNA polymerase sigma factor (sigma-70 family)
LNSVGQKEAGFYTNSVNITAKIFAEHSDFIYAIIYYKVRDKAQADDIYQDFFLSLVAKPVPTGIKDIRSYLYRAITNDIIDANRRVDRYQARIRKYAEVFNYVTNNNTPEKTLITEEDGEIFKLIGRCLPSSEARAIKLRFKNNRDITEVAAKMSVDKRSVSRYISVGLKKIRHFLRTRKSSN